MKREKEAGEIVGLVKRESRLLSEKPSRQRPITKIEESFRRAFGRSLMRREEGVGAPSVPH